MWDVGGQSEGGGTLGPEWGGVHKGQSGGWGWGHMGVIFRGSWHVGARGGVHGARVGVGACRPVGGSSTQGQEYGDHSGGQRGGVMLRSQSGGWWACGGQSRGGGCTRARVGGRGHVGARVGGGGMQGPEGGGGPRVGAGGMWGPEWGERVHRGQAGGRVLYMVSHLPIWYSISPIWYAIPLSGISSPYQASNLPYLVSHPINESPKWNCSLLDIYDYYQIVLIICQVTSDKTETLLYLVGWLI